MDAKSYDTVRDLATALGDFLAQGARQTEEIEKLKKWLQESNNERDYWKNLHDEKEKRHAAAIAKLKA